MDIKNVLSAFTPGENAGPIEKPSVVKLAMAIGASAAVALVGGIVWGFVGYFTGFMYFWIAVAIGFVISLATMMFVKRIDMQTAIILAIPCVILSVISVALGDFIYYTLFAAGEMGLSMGEAVQQVMKEFISLETSSDGLLSLGMGGIGAIVGFYRAVVR